MTSCASRYFTAIFLAFLAGFILLPSSKAVNNFFYVFLLLPAFLLMITGRAPRPQLSILSALWLIFFFWLALSGIWGIDSSKHLKYLFFTASFCLIIWLWVSWRFLEKTVLFQFFFWGLIAYVAVSAAFLWLTEQVAVGERVLSLPSRLDGPILTSMLIVSCFALLLPEWLRHRCWLKVLTAVLAVLFCVGFVLQSRSGLVGLAVLLAAALGCAAGRGGWWVRTSLVLVALSIGLVSLWLVQVNEVAAGLIVRGDSGRFELWQFYFQEWMKCGVFLGCGPGFDPEIQIEGGLLIQHPHNILLAVGFRYGLPGLLLFSGIMVATLQQAWENKSVWGGYLLIALFMLNFDGRELVDSPHEVWLLVLLPAILIAARAQQATEKNNDDPHLAAQ